jgi:hypothetical protein
MRMANNKETKALLSELESFIDNPIFKFIEMVSDDEGVKKVIDEDMKKRIESYKRQIQLAKLMYETIKKVENENG